MAVDKPARPAESRRYKVGIIGCGWIGCGLSEFTDKIKEDTHLAAYKACEHTDVVVLCDSNPSERVRELKINLFTDYMEMVKELDIVSICTPPETHCKIVCDIAPYVKAIYCEKPIATTLKEADRMIEVCKKHNVILQINHERNFMRPKFHFSRGWIDTGTHMFALLRHLFGDFEAIYPNVVSFKSGLAVDIEYVNTTGLPWNKAHIFELDCTHNTELMIPEGVKRLVRLLDEYSKDVANAEDAREALRAALEAQRRDT